MSMYAVVQRSPLPVTALFHFVEQSSTVESLHVKEEIDFPVREKKLGSFTSPKRAQFPCNCQEGIQKGLKLQSTYTILHQGGCSLANYTLNCTASIIPWDAMPYPSPTKKLCGGSSLDCRQLGAI